MSNEAVCRTAPATPGLLNTVISNISGDFTRKLKKLLSFTATFGVLCESHSCITLPELVVMELM